MARGIDGIDIFSDDEDRFQFLQYIHVYVIPAEIRCYAWALMPNHYHLVIRSSDRELAIMMKPLNSGYARYYNKKHGRRGYLFQDRFKSVASQDQLYLEEMIRYVHLNPVRAGICSGLDELDSYPWCGHAVLMGTRACGFQDVDTVLKRFGKDRLSARKGYRQFLENGLVDKDNSIINAIRASSAGKSDRSNPALWVIGDQKFVERAAEKDHERRLRLVRYAANGWNLEQVCRHVANALGINESDMMVRGRGDRRSAGRKMVAYLAHRQLEIPVSAVARYFNIGQSSVSEMLAEGEILVKKYKCKPIE